MSEVLRCSVFSEVYRGEIEYRAEKAIILNMTLLMIIACCLVMDSEAVWSYNISHLETELIQEDVMMCILVKRLCVSLVMVTLHRKPG